MTDSDERVGQWVGKIAGTNKGYMTLNIDRDRSNCATIHVDDPQSPLSAQGVIALRSTTVNGKLSLFTPHGHPLPPGFSLPQEGEYSGAVTGDRLTGTWSTNLQTRGEFDLIRREALKVRLPDHVMRWQEFRTWALEEPQRKTSLLFRGHDSSLYSLVTSFHRTGRRNLLHYGSVDVPRLCRLMEAVLNTKYDLLDPLNHGCLLNIAQHHGYPTPLLDWTESPFVAVFLPSQP